VPDYTILEAPSILGLWPSGVERLPGALLSAGLGTILGADSAGRVEPPPYDSRRDPETRLLNGDAIRAYSRSLADAVMPLVAQGRFPVVLGFSELSEVLGAALESGRAVGVTITIFNPVLDPDGGIARRLARSIAAGLCGPA
jgi:arginase